MKIAPALFLLMLTGCSARVPVQGGTAEDPIYSSPPPVAPVAGLRESPKAAAQAGKSKLIRIYFNPYTDSIKPVLNYYINVEGEFSDGTFLPLTTEHVRITSDVGTVEGNEWIIKPPIPWKQVTFHAVAHDNPALKVSITQHVIQGRSEEDERIMRGGNR